MIAAQRGAVDEVNTPLRFDVRAAAVGVVRVRVRVAAKPEINRARIDLQIIFERTRRSSQNE